MKLSPRQSRGYTLTELLVVVAIIAMLSLVTVPAFINFSRTNSIQSALRGFTADLRNCRQRAISRNSRVLLEIDSSTTYSFWESTDSGATYTAISATGPGSWLPSTSQTKTLDKVVTFSADTLTSD